MTGLAGGFRKPGPYLLWGIAAGIVGTISLAMFYLALATGTMGVLAPIAATGVAIPVIVGLLSGERPGPVRLVGIATAGLGVVLASGPEIREAPRRRRAIGLTLVSAVGFGSVYVFLAKGSATSVGMTLLLQRATGTLVMGALVLVSRGPRAPALRDLPALVGVGLMDMTANAAFGFASRLGSLAITATLGSLYPIVTAALARLLLDQHLRRIQVAGVVFVMAGVVLLTI